MTYNQRFSDKSYSLFTKPDISVGVLGGTFDPPHLAHLILGETLLNSNEFDLILFTPAFNPWQKNGLFSSYEHRLEMLKLSIKGNSSFFYSEIEKVIGAESSTLQTYIKLKELFPSVIFRFILGSDAANGLDTWKNSNVLKRECDFVFISRPGEELNVDSGWKYSIQAAPALDISATNIRHLVKNGSSIRYLVKEDVRQYISEHQLYKGN